MQPEPAHVQCGELYGGGCCRARLNARQMSNHERILYTLRAIFHDKKVISPGHILLTGMLPMYVVKPVFTDAPGDDAPLEVSMLLLRLYAQGGAEPKAHFLKCHATTDPLSVNPAPMVVAGATLAFGACMQCNLIDVDIARHFRDMDAIAITAQSIEYRHESLMQVMCLAVSDHDITLQLEPVRQTLDPVLAHTKRLAKRKSLSLTTPTKRPARTRLCASAEKGPKPTTDADTRTVAADHSSDTHNTRRAICLMQKAQTVPNPTECCRML